MTGAAAEISQIVFDERLVIMRFIVFAFLVLPLIHAASCDPSHARPWTPSTSVEMRYFTDVSGTADGPGLGGEPALAFLASPDGEKFLVVERRGDLGSDSNLFELKIYGTRQVAKAVEAGASATLPVLSIIRRSQPRSTLPEFGFPKWSNNARYVLFTGAQEGVTDNGEIGVPATFRLDTANGAVTRVGPGEDEKGNYIVDIGEGYSIFADYLSLPPQLNASPVYPAEVLTFQAIERIRGASAVGGGLAENKNRLVGLFSLDLLSGQKKLLAQIGAEAEFNVLNISRGQVAPHKDVAVVTTAVSQTPSGWQRYNMFGKRLSFGMGLDGEETRPIQSQRFVLVDLKRGFIKPLLDAPTGEMTSMGRDASYQRGLRPSVRWHRDSRVAVLVNAAMPIAGRQSQVHEAYVAAYDVEKGRVKVITPIATGRRLLQDVRWSEDGNYLITEWRAAKSGRERATQVSTIAYRFQRGEFSVDRRWTEPRNQSQLLWKQNLPVSGESPSSWTDRSPSHPLSFSNGLSLVLDESANEPQQLIAKIGTNSLRLSDPDSALEHIVLAPAKVIVWKGSTGTSYRALLTLPQESGERRFPLVVQLSQFSPTLFRPDGVNSYSTQALAARGLAVLTLNAIADAGSGFIFAGTLRAGHEPSSPNLRNEIDSVAEYVQSALSAVALNQTLNMGKIGVIGFSRQGFYARQLLLRPGAYKVSTAIALDSYFPSFSGLTYWAAQAQVAFPNVSNVQREYFGPMHGLVDDDASFWNENAVDLAAAKSTGGLLEYVHSATYPELDMHFVPLLAPFQLAGRPVEVRVAPNGGHILESPKQRLAEITSVVDWMDFWLNDHQDAGAGKAAMYSRWKEMQDRWVRQQSWEAAGHPMGSTPKSDVNYADRTVSPYEGTTGVH